MIKLDYQETWYEKAEREELETPSPNEAKPLTEAEQLLQEALSHVESESIREWVNSEQNRPTWIKIAELAIEKKPVGSPDISLFSALIVATAIGL